MKSISLLPEWALPVALGIKTVECRTWKTDYRGELLICASSKKLDARIHGYALATVSLDGIEPFTQEHLFDALMFDDELPNKDSFAWLLSNARLIEPFKVKGKLHLFETDDSLIKTLGEPTKDLVERYFKPLVYRGRDSVADEYWTVIYELLGW